MPEKVSAVAVTKRRICFVGSDNYPILNPAYGGEYIGGESVQQTLLARAFVGQGYEVSMVVKDFGQSDGELIENIRVWKTYQQNAGIPVMRFLYPRLISTIRALGKADADIYYQSCAGMLTEIVAWFCKQHNRKYIFRIAHDTDCISGKQIIKYARDRKLYEYGLKRANLIAAQGINQQSLLADNYHLDSVVVNMAVEMDRVSSDEERDIDVLWVNNMRQFKRPELAVELARSLPKCSFTMIGGMVPGQDNYFDKIRRLAKDVDNLDFKGAVPYHDVNEYFRRARVFVNTSESEGFPNSFLQAWARGVPVISFFDPDGLIEQEGLGYSPNSLPEMVEAVGRLLSDTEKRITSAKRAHEFVQMYYSAEAVAQRYIGLIGD